MQDAKRKMKKVTLIPTICTLIAILMTIHTTVNVKREETTTIIKYTFIEKGFFMTLQYKVQLYHYENPASISKQQYEQLLSGQRITGYQKLANTFFTAKAVKKSYIFGAHLILIFIMTASLI